MALKGMEKRGGGRRRWAGLVGGELCGGGGAMADDRTWQGNSFTVKSNEHVNNEKKVNSQTKRRNICTNNNQTDTQTKNMQQEKVTPYRSLMDR